MRTIVTMSLLVYCCLGGFVSEGHAAGVTVELTSGRSFSGQIDPASDETVLWLHWSRGTLSIVRPIQWDQVQAVVLGEDRYSSEEFRAALVTARASLATTAGSLEIEVSSYEPPVPPAVVETQAMEIVYRQVGGPPRPSAPIVPIVALELDVRPANWDEDVAEDGLVVQIRPRDASGALVAVEGTLSVDLVGKRKSAVNRPQDFLNLGRTTLAVHVEDFELDGATYRIPFQSPNPVFDTSLVPKGLVHAQLTVPGQGVVNASDPSVCFRPYSAFREDLEQATAWRYWRE